MNQEKVGKNILNIRKNHNLSQSQFANKLGVTSQAVSKWENGRGIPDIEILLRMKEEFKIDIDEIITGKKPRKRKDYKLYIVFSLVIVGILLFGIFHWYQMKYQDKYQIVSIGALKEDFSIKGISVQNKDTSFIYISNIVCNKKFNDEKKFIAVESMLYEDLSNNYKIISSYGNLDNIDTQDNQEHYLTELLDHIEFRVENLSNSDNINNHKYFILLNALVNTGEVISYKIPLTVTKG